MRGTLIVGALLVLGCELREPEQASIAPDEQAFIPIPVPEVTDRDVKPAHTVYLNREGAVLTSGRDESNNNVSSIVPRDMEELDIPGWRGSAQRWDQMVECLRGHFEPYDVEIVDRRPTVPGYVMVVVGGTAEALHDEDRQISGAITGLAPFNGQPIENAVTLVFSRTLRESARRTCEVAAMEIGHAFGLDHSRHCRDLMSFRRPCGSRRFETEAAPCGTTEDRACHDGAPTQSSHERLLEVLGARIGR